MKFRSKNRVIDAEQFTDYLASPQVRGVTVEFFAGAGCAAFVTTIHGQKTDVVPGDWIVREPDGRHFYPVKPDVFEANYEALDSDDNSEGNEGAS